LEWLQTCKPLCAIRALLSKKFSQYTRLKLLIPYTSRPTNNRGETKPECLINYEYRTSKVGRIPATFEWVHDNRWKLPHSQRVPITRNGESYDEFPTSDDLHDFDIADRKFIAVANAMATKWPILQATDSKWWGWKEALAKAGITVCFLCPDYVKNKYDSKMKG